MGDFRSVDLRNCFKVRPPRQASWFTTRLYNLCHCFCQYVPLYIYAWCICVYIYTYICIVSLDYIILDLVWFDMLYIYIYMHLIHIIWSTWSPWINPATCSVSFRATASAGLRSPALVDEFLVGFRWDVDRNSCAFMGFAVDGIYIDYVGFHVFSWNLDGV